MYSSGTLIERWWRGVADAKRQGTFAMITALASMFVGPTAPGRSDRKRHVRDRRHPNVGGLFGVVATAVDDLTAVPHVMTESFLDAFSRTRSNTGWTSTETNGPDVEAETWTEAGPNVEVKPGVRDVSRAPTEPAAIILEQANAFLDSVPGCGALLLDLIDNVVLQTGCDETMVRSIVLRNFESNGMLIWRSTSRRGGPLGTVNRMRRLLRNLGYTDLRDDYPLTAVPTRGDRAVLLAFDGTDPAVLCYPVNPGEVGDPMIREAALFQAAAVAQGVTSRFVWVSDGLSDLFYDFRMRLVLSELPYRITTGTVGP